jgi:hypothetical protein
MAANKKAADVLQDTDRRRSEPQPSSKGNERVSTVTNPYVSDTEHRIALDAGKTIEHHAAEELDGSDVGWPIIQFTDADEPWFDLYLAKYERDDQWTAYFYERNHGDMSIEQIVYMAARFTEAAQLATRLNGVTR